MAWELVGQGGILDAYTIRQYEDSVEEGKRVALNIDLRTSLPSLIVNQIRSQLQNLGVPGLSVTSGSWLRVEWIKKVPQALIVVAIILALVLAILIIGWKFFKEVGVVGQVGLILLVLVLGVMLAERYLPKRKEV